VKALFLLPLFCLPAFAEVNLERANPGTFSKTNNHDGDYFGTRTGDHYEWTMYQQDYARVNYGHRFEWTKTGLSNMSVCVEVDPETGGSRYRALVDEAYCPKMETAFRWMIPFEGQTSRCVEYDKQSGGQHFSRLSDNSRCAKPAVTYVWSKKYESARPDCNEVDLATEGRQYRRPARDYFCAKTLNVQVAYGRKQPYLPSRAPASVARPESRPAIVDKKFWEDPEDLVDHVYRSEDKIHQR
jgi:hypothetical protein